MNEPLCYKVYWRKSFTVSSKDVKLGKSPGFCLFVCFLEPQFRWLSCWVWREWAVETRAIVFSWEKTATGWECADQASTEELKQWSMDRQVSKFPQFPASTSEFKKLKQTRHRLAKLTGISLTATLIANSLAESCGLSCQVRRKHWESSARLRTTQAHLGEEATAKPWQLLKVWKLLKENRCEDWCLQLEITDHCSAASESEHLINPRGEIVLLQKLN